MVSTAPYGSSSATQVSRPGCITVYAVLLWVTGSSFTRSAESAGPALMVGLVFFAGCIGLLGLIPIVTGIGLWQMKSWAWWVVVVLQSIGLALTLLSLCSNLAVVGMSAGRSTGTAANAEAVVRIMSALIGGLINGGILYWFISNRSLFGGGAASQGAQAASGGDTGTVVTIVLGLVGIAIMIPIVIIIILALLGPAIGNVFSNILLGL